MFIHNHQRRDRGRRTLQPRDKKGIVFIAEQKVARLDQIGQWLAPDLEPATSGGPAGEKQAPGGLRTTWPTDGAKRNHATRQLVSKWEDMAYVKVFRPWAHEPLWIMATPKAFRDFGLPYKDAPFPDLDDLPHFYEITRVRLQLARAKTMVAPHTWISERSLAAELPGAQAGIPQPHLADGALQLINGKRAIGVEVELSIKDYAELDRIFHDLLGQYISIWYFCNDKTYPVIEHIRAQYPEDIRKRIRLFHLDDEKDITD